MLDHLSIGFELAAQPENLLFCLLGVTLGTIIGVLPGLGSSSGIAILLPLVLTMEPLPALIMLAGVYYGCEYGGTICSVLLGVPGEGASIVTVIEGHKMALKGLAGQALAIAAIGSFFAGTISIVALSLAAPVFADLAINFGSPEMFALMVLGLVTVAGLVGTERSKGYAMAAMGAALAMIGLDPVSGTPRFTLGLPELHFGLTLIAVVIGMVAFAELITQGAQRARPPIKSKYRDLLLSRRDLKKSSGAIGRGGVLGFLVGCLPGAGPTLSTFFSYALEKKLAAGKPGDEFGRGDIRGVAGPESANNAAVNGALVPTLSLGIPGSGTTTILLGAFIAFGIQPGPLLLERQEELVWGLIASFYIGNIVLLVLNLPLAPLFAAFLRIPYTYIYPVVVAIAMIAAFALNATLSDAWIALAAGGLGFFMLRYGYPVAPAILGLILGPLLETHLRRSLAMGVGSPDIFLERPIALSLFAVTLLAIAAPLVIRFIRRRAA